MHASFRNTLAIAGFALALPALAQVTFYEHDGFAGRSFTTQRAVGNFERFGFNDRASSAVVRGERWEVCDDARFRGRCVVLRPGQYPSFSAMGLNDRVSSVRTVDRQARIDDERYAPPPVVARDYRRRDHERLYQARVTSVRAVVGTPERRCWVERGEVVQQSQQRSGANVPGAVIGAVIGGILGHQIGGGTGRDVATAGGVVAGAAIGANAGRDRNAPTAYGPDVERCANVPNSAQPDYWDVTYEFRGRDFRVQMTTAPGDTVTVNRAGEPRA